MKLEWFPVWLGLLLVAVSEFGGCFDSKCPPLRLVSGRSRYRWRGRSVRFNCMRGFQLVGVKYATCMNGKWDADAPICVKYGCRAPSTIHVNGQFIESYRGAVVKIVCNPGYALFGSPSVYCNGIRWNETFPVCKVANSNPALSCDFEDPDLCGWTQDPMHDFDWKRQNGSSEGQPGTGPKFDQLRGNFMFIGNFTTENETARLYSPVYQKEHSKDHCFQFSYRITGSPSGQLKVYVKPEGVELYDLIPSYWVDEEMGQNWNRGSFSIDAMTSPFQIVVEGVSGGKREGDVAFDDVKLTSEENCVFPEDSTTSTEFSTSVIPYEDAIDLLTCKTRCHEPPPANVSDTDEGSCFCHDTCDRDGTCCSDFFELCESYFDKPTQNVTDKPSNTSQNDTKVSPSSSSLSSTQSTPKIQPSATTPKHPPKTPPTPLPPSSPKPPPKVTPPKNFNNESNEIDPKKPFPEFPPNRTSFVPLRRENLPPAPPFPPPGRRIIPRNETASKSRVPLTGTEVKTKVQDRKKNATASGRKEVKVQTTPVVTSSTSTTPARVTKNTRPSNIKLTFLEKPSSTLLSTKGKSKESSGKEPPQAITSDAEERREGTIQGVLEVGGTAVAVVIILVLGLLWYRRSRSRKTERESMVEDSDVRFLTSDEVLDFTLARPADDDL